MISRVKEVLDLEDPVEIVERSKNSENFLLIGESSSDATDNEIDVNLLGNTQIRRRQTIKDKKLKKGQKYHDDIVHILKYAEESNPHSLVLELCQNLKWPFPDIESIQITENNVNVYKTNAKLKKFSGEGVGITKKISKKKACIELITNMVQDKILRNSMRIYIDTKNITRDGRLKVEDDDDDVKFEEEDYIVPVYKAEDLDSKRVQQIITEYTKNPMNNPLCQLDSFRNRFNIPHCFTYTIKHKMHKAVLYVGGEIFGYAIDANIRVAKYKAGEEGIKKIKEKYGEDALKFKAVERRKNKMRLMEEEKLLAETTMEPVTLKINKFQSSDEILKDLSDFTSTTDKNSLMQSNLELMLFRLERCCIPLQNYVEIHKALSLLFHLNKTLSIHFNNPILIGSFQYDCPSVLHQTVDLLLYHTLNADQIKDSLDNLVKKFKDVLKDFCQDFFVNIFNRVDETNLDVMLRCKTKAYSFRLIIRDERFKVYIYYLKVHNSRVNNQVKHTTIFNILRRLLRIWRRQHKLLFLKPEILDWIIKHFLKSTLSSTLVTIFHKCGKNFKKVLLKIEEFPDILKDQVEDLTEDQIQEIKMAMKMSMEGMVKGDNLKLMKISSNN